VDELRLWNGKELARLLQVRNILCLTEDSNYRYDPDHNAQLLQVADNTSVSPESIFPAHSLDQASDFVADLGSARTLRFDAFVALSEPFLISFGSHDVHDPSNLMITLSTDPEQLGPLFSVRDNTLNIEPILQDSDLSSKQ